MAIRTEFDDQEVKLLLETSPKAVSGEVLPKLQAKYIGTEIYYDYEDQTITDFIPCSKIKPNADLKTRKSFRSSCDHYGSIGTLGFHIWYDKDFLPEHKRIKDSALEFIKCAIVESP